MKLRNLLFRAILSCCVVSIFGLQTLAKDAWTKARSKNFNVIGDASEKDVRNVAAALEQFRQTFQQLFVNVNLNSQIPLNIVVFKNRQSLKDFGPLDQNDAKTNSINSYFQNEEAANYIAVSVESENPAENFGALFHEYTHFLINENFGRANVQPWFNEGLAQYLEFLEIANAQNTAAGKSNNEYLQILKQNKLIPLETFFEADYYSLQKQGNHGSGLFYAESWALMCYLMRSENPARDAQLNKFIQLVLNGKKQEYAFAEAFQTDYKTLEIEFKKYIKQKISRADVKNYTNDSVDESEIQSAPVSDADAKIILGDLLYQSERFSEAAAMLEDAAKFNNTASAANSLLGLVKLKLGKSNEAEKYLEKAVALNDKNYLAHFRYAYVLSRQGMTDYGFASSYSANQAARIRDELDKAIALNPYFPESYNLYAFVNYVRTEAIDRAIVYIEKALKIAPGNQRYQIRLAELSMLKEDFGKARNIARKTFETAPDERLRVYAKNTIYTIDTYESQLDSLRNPSLRRLQNVTDKPLSEEENARLNWLTMLSGINQNLRKLKSNERRVLGYLSKVECQANEIDYSVKVENQVLNLSSENFDSVKLVTFVPEMANGQVGCGTVKKELFAVIGYRPSENPNAKSAGEILSIEFVPKNFRFLD